MIPAPIPSNEARRLDALRALLVLDTAPEERFDRITRFAASEFDTPFALVSLVDGNRQWFKARVGLDACETARDISFCGHAIHSSDVLVIEDARSDPRFADNPLVEGDQQGIRLPDVLLAESDLLLRHAVVKVAGELGLAQVHGTSDVHSAVALMESQAFDAIIIALDHKGDALDLLTLLRCGQYRSQASTPVALLAGSGPGSARGVLDLVARLVQRKIA